LFCCSINNEKYKSSFGNIATLAPSVLIGQPLLLREVFIMDAIQCIYIIKSTIKPHKYYVGSTIDFNRRVFEHKNELIQNKHCNRILQNHSNKYGIGDLSFEIIELIMFKELILSREQFFMNKLKPVFNICKIAGRTDGVVRSAEFKLKVSISKSGKKHNPIHSMAKSIRQKGIKHNYNYKHTEDAKNRISKSEMKCIIQYNLNGNYIKEWESIKEASIVLGICSSSISSCCLKKIKKAGNYKWTFKTQPL